MNNLQILSKEGYIFLSKDELLTILNKTNIFKNIKIPVVHKGAQLKINILAKIIFFTIWKNNNYALYFSNYSLSKEEIIVENLQYSIGEAILLYFRRNQEISEIDYMHNQDIIKEFNSYIF